MAIERQLRPAEMLQVFAGNGLVKKVAYRCRDSRLMPVALQGKQHHARWPRDRLRALAEHDAVSIVDAAVVESPIKKQTHAFLHARVITLTSLAKRQASPRSRLDPGKVMLRPGPTDQVEIDVVHLDGLCLVGLAALPGEDSRGSSLDLVPGILGRHLPKEHQCGR